MIPDCWCPTHLTQLVVELNHCAHPDQKWLCKCGDCYDYDDESTFGEVGYGPTPLAAAEDYAEKCGVDSRVIIHQGEKHI